MPYAPPAARSLSRLPELARTPFSVDERRVGRRAVLAVAGEVDLTTAADLEAAIESAAGGAFEIWLDLSAATFMDTSGVHAIVRARARLAEADRRLAVICPSGPILRVLTLTGADRHLEIHRSRSAANDAPDA